MSDEHEGDDTELAVVETVGITPQMLATVYVRPDEKSKVAKSQLFAGIIDRILAGWSGQRMSSWLLTQGESISARALETYRERHIRPTGAITAAPLRGLLEDAIIVIDERRDLEEIILLQRARCRALILQESGVDNIEELGTCKEKFTHKPFLYKEMEALANLLKQLRQLRKEEGALSELASRVQQAEEVILEKTTTEKLTMSNAGQVYRILQGLEAIADGKPPPSMPDVTIREVEADESTNGE